MCYCCAQQTPLTQLSIKQYMIYYLILTNPVILFVVDVFMVFLANVPWREDVIPEIEDGLHGMSSWNHNSTLIPYNFLGGIHVE
jgi:hypothetical protein